MAWYWQPVTRRLRDAGHDAIALELPADDPEAGLTAYIELAVAVGREHPELVVAAQSMGAFTAVPLCERIPARRLVLLNAMVPNPGETAGDWWEHTGAPEARRAAALADGYSEAFDLDTYFLHDVPPEVLATSPQRQPEEADIAFAEPCPFTRWPEVPTTVLAGSDDRFFPFAFQRRVARERLGMEITSVPGGHLAALSQPAAVTDALLRAAAAPSVFVR